MCWLRIRLGLQPCSIRRIKQQRSDVRKTRDSLSNQHRDSRLRLYLMATPVHQYIPGLFQPATLPSFTITKSQVRLPLNPPFNPRLARSSRCNSLTAWNCPLAASTPILSPTPTLSLLSRPQISFPKAHSLPTSTSLDSILRAHPLGTPSEAIPRSAPRPSALPHLRALVHRPQRRIRQETRLCTISIAILFFYQNRTRVGRDSANSLTNHLRTVSKVDKKFRS